MFGQEKELLPKDLLVDLESNPSRVDKMLAILIDGEKGMDFGTPFSASAFASVPSSLTESMRVVEELQRQQMMAIQQNNQFTGGNGNGAAQQGALRGFGGIFGSGF